MDIKEEILAQMDSALRPEFDKAIDNTIEGAFKEDVKTLGFMVANSIKCQWEVMKPHLFYAYCLGVKAQEAKAQAVPEWISVEDKLPETEPNTDGVVCAVVCSLGNVYRARYMHDVDIGVDTKYWSEFAVNYNGREYEHYEINAKISHWMPLPDAPQEPANEL